jgi:anti-sigma regulatory factor (Ser/Thr protein kinase)
VNGPPATDTHAGDYDLLSVCDVSRLRGDVQQWCARLGVAGEVAFRAALVVDELCVNALTHGREVRRGVPTGVSVELVASTWGVTVRLVDDAAPFDPRPEVSACGSWQAVSTRSTTGGSADATTSSSRSDLGAAADAVGPGASPRACRPLRARRT